MRGWWFLAALVCVAACNARSIGDGLTRDSAVPGEAAACEVNATAACVCDTGGVGRQVCVGGGLYGPCQCAGDGGAPRDVAPDAPTFTACEPQPAVDLLFVVDNSNSMRDNQAQLGRQISALVTRLTNPPVDPMTSMPVSRPVTSLRVGVVSTDLGTPGTQIPSCANSDVGDDGQLNPIRRGLAIRTHQPWVTTPASERPPRCTNDPNQYPLWLSYDAAMAVGAPNYTTRFLEDFVCNAYLSTGGCGLEQQLESAYRALVVHNAREAAGNTAPNAGFVRDDAVLAIVVLSDEEDGSTRDCRFAEAGQPCNDATGVYDSTSSAWASRDLNLRFYLYQPGTQRDPTWPIDRYIDPANPRRGFTSLKPEHPQWVVFGAITGVPIDVPLRAGSSDPRDIDWGALLNVDTLSDEGPISMRQAQTDGRCPSRVVPACRRQGTSYNPSNCDTSQQYFAWPARRIAQVAQRFDESYRNGYVSSICRTSYSDALTELGARIAGRICR